jgi:voltage-gated potassium channel
MDIEARPSGTLARLSGVVPTSVSSVLQSVARAARKSIILKLILLLLCIFAIAGVAVYFVERNSGGGIRTLGEAYWWLIVVVTKAPGYTGTFPETVGGRAIAFALIIIGLSFIPVITAKIASTMVTRKLREERGLEKIRARNHTVVCGWNEHLDAVVEGVVARRGDREVVLVNTAGTERMNELLLRHKDDGVKYVHGDYTSEAILDLANIRQAGAAIVLVDSVEGDRSNADEKIVLAALAVKTMNPKAWICVEVTDSKTVSHARRAGASEVVVHGEHDPFLIASAAAAEGVLLASRELLSHREGNTLQQRVVPAEYVGKKFGELSEYFREKHEAILIGVFNAGKSLRPEDVLSGDYSLIDDFIERKFKEAGKDYLSAKVEVPKANLNPGGEYVVRSGDVALVIGR